MKQGLGDVAQLPVVGSIAPIKKWHLYTGR